MQIIFIFRVVFSSSYELPEVWVVFVLMKKGIIFGAYCLNFSFIVKIYRLRFWFWYLLGIIVVLRLILCCIEWSCYWITNVMVNEKTKIMVCKFISNWVSWFVRRWFCLLVSVFDSPFLNRLEGLLV